MAALNVIDTSTVFTISLLSPSRSMFSSTFNVQSVGHEVTIRLKNPENASTRLSMNGNSPMISTAPPFVPSIYSGQALRLSKDERKVFQQNQFIRSNPVDQSAK